MMLGRAALLDLCDQVIEASRADQTEVVVLSGGTCGLV